MISPRDLYVKAGDLVIPAWRRLVEYLASMPVMPGVGVLVSRGRHGTVVNARAWLVGFSGAWSMGTPGGKYIDIGDGYCNGLVPEINKKPLIPLKSTDLRPKLELKEKLFDKTGRSWICLEAEVDKDGVLLKKNPLRLVQADHPYFTTKKEIGRTPLAVLFRAEKKTGLGQLHRIAYHDLQHRFSGKRHFFFV